MSFALIITHRAIIEDGIAKHMVKCIAFSDMLAALADDDH